MFNIWGPKLTSIVVLPHIKPTTGVTIVSATHLTRVPPTTSKYMHISVPSSESSDSPLHSYQGKTPHVEYFDLIPTALHQGFLLYFLFCKQMAYVPTCTCRLHLSTVWDGVSGRGPFYGIDDESSSTQDTIYVLVTRAGESTWLRIYYIGLVIHKGDVQSWHFAFFKNIDSSRLQGYDTSNFVHAKRKAKSPKQLVNAQSLFARAKLWYHWQSRNFQIMQ